MKPLSCQEIFNNCLFSLSNCVKYNVKDTCSGKNSDVFLPNHVIYSIQFSSTYGVVGIKKISTKWSYSTISFPASVKHIADDWF